MKPKSKKTHMLLAWGRVLSVEIVTRVELIASKRHRLLTSFVIHRVKIVVLNLSLTLREIGSMIRAAGKGPPTRPYTLCRDGV